MPYSKEELIERIVKLSQGRGVIAISQSDWELLRNAYGGNALLHIIAERALYIRPIVQAPGDDIIFT